MEAIVNPYLSRLAVDKPHQFYGRKREIDQILTRIVKEAAPRLNLWGAPRIGKSSLLRRLCALSSTGTVYLDLYRLRNPSLEDFLGLILPALGRGEQGALDLTQPPDGAFVRALAEVSQSGGRLVLLLDQFDSLDRYPSFQKYLAAYLHSLTRDYRFSWVWSSSRVSRTVAALPADGDSVISEGTAWLRPFSRDEALELVTLPSERAGRPLAAFGERILEMAGLSPFFLQIACSAFFDRLIEHPDEAPGLADIQEAFQDEAGPHLEFLVDQLGPDSLPLLKDLATTGKTSVDRISEQCPLLAWAGLVVPEDERFMAAPSMFRSYLQDQLGARSPVTETGGSGTEAAQPLTAGTTVRLYRVLEPAGVTGQVYKAERLTGGGLVALKMVKPERSEAAAFLKTSQEEIGRVAAISHEALARVSEVFDHQGSLVVISEWLEGETLKEKLKREGRIPAAQLLKWMVDACAGLGAAARQGLIHRHIKPSNLMIAPKGQLKILDFGLFDHPLQAPQCCSPRSIHPDAIYYLSPEQASGQQVDARSDLFSLGVVIFEGLTGRLPFRRSSPSSTLQAILNDPVPDLASPDLELAESMEPVLFRLLQKHPSRRYQTAAEVERDLKRLVSQSRRRLFGRRF
jgi:eukaryotic-like serine/threonine-protein kinase